jgi:polyhydroxyalkanoate synthesis regulator phasin
MAAKAHEISLEAGSKMAAAMKDVINAAAGITGFVLESARDLVQYMVRRGQMTQEEADKLIRQAEEAQASRPKSSTASVKNVEKTPPAVDSPLAVEEGESAKPVEPKSTAKPATKKTATKSVAPEDKPAAKKTAAKSAPTAKKAATKKK